MKILFRRTPKTCKQCREYNRRGKCCSLARCKYSAKR